MMKTETDHDWIETLPAEIGGHVRKLTRLPHYPRQLAKFSGALRKLNKAHKATAQEIALKARRLDPRDTLVRVDTAWAFKSKIPGWHYLIINDEERNDLYRRAIEAHVQPGMTVFEIGTGTGLLAMLAARAGAGHVYTCEREPLLAEAARENIARNGLADRITVLEKDSKDVALGADLPHRADLMVCEIVDNGLLGEQALELTEDALQRLLKPDAVLLPDAIELRGTLVGGPEWTSPCRARKACGFEVSAIDWLGPARSSVTQNLQLDGMADDATLLHFDMARAAEYRAQKSRISIPVRQDGQADALVTWIWLRFGDQIEFSNRPPTSSCWYPMVHHFPEPLAVQAGTDFTVGVRHDRRRITVWPETPTGT